MKSSRLGYWLVAVCVTLGLLDAALRIHLNPIEGWIIVLHDPGKTFFHLVVLPLVVWIAANHYALHRAQCSVAVSAPAKFTLVLLMAVAAAGAVIESRSSFKDRLTAAEDIADKGFRDQLAQVRKELRDGLVTGANQSDDSNGSQALKAKNKSNELAAEVTAQAVAQYGSWYQAASPRRLIATVLAAFGFIATAYVLWLLVCTARGIFPWASTGRALYLMILLLSIWPLLNGYSEVWRNFGVAPESNPAQELALVFIAFAVFLAAIAFGKQDDLSLVPRILKAMPELSSAIPAALIYKYSDPTLMLGFVEHDDYTFLMMQLIVAAMLWMIVLAVEKRLLMPVSPRPPLAGQ